MSVIHIKLLPFDSAFDIERVGEEITQDFVAAVGVSAQHGILTRTFVVAGHRFVAGKVADKQSSDSDPTLVDLLLPDFQHQKTREQILRDLADSIATWTQVSNSNVFIHCRTAASGTIFDHGKIARG